MTITSAFATGRTVAAFLAATFEDNRGTFENGPQRTGLQPGRDRR